MLSYDKMTTLSVGSQDQLDGMAISHKFKFVDILYQNVRNVGYVTLYYFYIIYTPKLLDEISLGRYNSRTSFSIHSKY
ncbi:hypothetical protein C5S29_04990 [ANME-1 cluster archaeon GoMg3.2]|nr:hypothetical protein [ANME-1 cluster archaeon GoMg3.2]